MDQTCFLFPLFLTRQSDNRFPLRLYQQPNNYPTNIFQLAKLNKSITLCTPSNPSLSVLCFFPPQINLPLYTHTRYQMYLKPIIGRLLPILTNFIFTSKYR